jgi:hypothetical protein
MGIKKIIGVIILLLLPLFSFAESLQIDVPSLVNQSPQSQKIKKRNCNFAENKDLNNEIDKKHKDLAAIGNDTENADKKRIDMIRDILNIDSKRNCKYE